MGLADFLVLIGFVQSPLPVGNDAQVAEVTGLAAAVDTAAGTGHNLHRVELAGITVFDLLHQRPGIAQAAGHGHVQGNVAHSHVGFLNTIAGRADFFEFDLLQALSGNPLVGGPQGGLHDAAGLSEDDRRAGGFTHRIVKIFLFHLPQIQVHLLDQFRQLCGGQRDVNIRDTIPAHLLPAGLRLFRSAGHDRHRDHLRGIHADLLRKIALGGGAEHFHGRFGRRGQVQHIRELRLQEVHPGGAAGGQQRQGRLLPLQEGRQPSYQLVGLLHDRHIRGKIRIEHIIEAQTAQGRRHLPGHDAAGLIAELLAQGHPDSGRRVNHNHLLRIVEGFDDPVQIALDRQRTHRTGLYALAAAYADGVADGLVEGRGDHRVKAPVNRRQRAHRLDLIADVFAPAAHNAFIRIPDNGIGAVHGIGGHGLAGDPNFPDAQVFGHGLQFALAGLVAGEAVLRMVGEQQLHHGPPGLLDLGGVGADHHALRNGGGAGRSQVAPSGNLHHADAAGGGPVFKAQLMQVHIAQGRNMNAYGFSRLQNCAAGFCLRLHSVNGKMNHFRHCHSLPSYRFSTAPKRQPSMQAPHLMHLAWSIT